MVDGNLVDTVSKIEDHTKVGSKIESEIMGIFGAQKQVKDTL